MAAGKSVFVLAACLLVAGARAAMNTDRRAYGG
jgi:hypothetical protein